MSWYTGVFGGGGEQAFAFCYPWSLQSHHANRQSLALLLGRMLESPEVLPSESLVKPSQFDQPLGARAHTLEIAMHSKCECQHG